MYTRTHTHTHALACRHAHTQTRNTLIPIHLHIYIHNGWPLNFEATSLLGKLAIPVCRHLIRHSCIVSTQHPQSQLVVYTVIIAEQTVINISEKECIYISVIKS